MADSERSWYDAFFGRLEDDGDVLELMGGTNFVGFTITRDSAHGRYNIKNSKPAITSSVVTTSEEFVGQSFSCPAISGTVLTFRACSFTAACAITATTIYMDRQSARSFQLAGGTVNVLPISLDPPDLRYGTGSNGNATITGNTTTGMAVEWANLTITTGSLGDNGGRTPILVSQLLDLTAAGVGAITDWFTAVGSGGNASGATGGSGGGAANGTAQGGPGTLGGQTGSNGGTGAGATPAALTAWRNAMGGKGGASGAGGTGAGVNAGGTGGASAGTGQNPMHPYVFFGVSPGLSTNNPETCWAGLPGRGGASGGGDGTNSGGGGGGSGSGAGEIFLYARGIKVGGSTPASCIRTQAPAGGQGGGVAAGNAGGGSGGGGGGGGFIFIYYEWLIGTPPANMISAPGGAGGNGGAGRGTGIGGAGGTGGDGGQIVLINTITGTRTVVMGSAGSAGGAASGTSGGSGGAGGTCLATLS